MFAAIPELAVERNAGAVRVVHVPTPDGAELPPRPRCADRAVGYQRVLLDVRGGKLSLFCRDWRREAPYPQPGEDSSAWDAQHPGTSVGFVPSGRDEVPELLSFHIDTWTPVDRPADKAPSSRPWVYMTREEGDAFVASLVPLAQYLIDHLFRVPGTEALEWSRESAAAVMAIDRACNREQQGPAGEVVLPAGSVNFADAVAELPRIVDGGWAELPDDELDERGRWLNGWAGNWPEMVERFGAPFPDNSGMTLEVYGARSWLRAYRAHEATGRLLIGAAEWFEQPERSLAGRVHAGDDDAAVAAFVEGESARAARDGVKLLNIANVVRAHRDRLRRRFVDEDLPRAVNEFLKLCRAKAGLAAALGAVVSWGDGRYHSDDDAALAKLCGLPEALVAQLRAAVTDYETDEIG